MTALKACQKSTHAYIIELKLLNSSSYGLLFITHLNHAEEQQPGDARGQRVQQVMQLPTDNQFYLLKIQFIAKIFHLFIPYSPRMINLIFNIHLVKQRFYAIK